MAISMIEGPFFLGVDGGGTGCRARLVNAQGAIVGEGQAGPAALRLGADQAWNAISGAVQNAISAARLQLPLNMIHAGIAVAGTSHISHLHGLTEKARAFAQVRIVSDGYAACLGAHGGADGGVVSAGTGSIAVAISGGKETRLGGYGLPVSDEGSGSHIGVQAVSHMLKVLDGRAPRSEFSLQWLRRFDMQLSAVMAWIGQAHATDYAALAPFVLACADQGDAAAAAIADAAGAALSDLIISLNNRGVKRIALIGGLASPLHTRLKDTARALLTPAHGDAMDGALMLAREADQA